MSSEKVVQEDWRRIIRKVLAFYDLYIFLQLYEKISYVYNMQHSFYVQIYHSYHFDINNANETCS